MSAEQYDTLQLVGRHIPDEPDPNRPTPHDTPNPVTGNYQIGVLYDGAFVPILEESAGRFFHLVEQAQALQGEQAQTDGQQQTAQGQTATQPQGVPPSDQGQQG